ncbi:hypothetical protein C8J57DRAFT_1728806 [Mycena rebaudengoi]|nr:hypothetical protein C8J57DRAFT_1728806 [Mycena rebaudengoi]
MLLRAPQNAGVERVVLDAGVQGADVSAGERQQSASTPVGAYPYGDYAVHDAAPDSPKWTPPPPPLAHPSLFLAAALLRAGMRDGVGGGGPAPPLLWPRSLDLSSSLLPRLVVTILARSTVHRLLHVPLQSTPGHACAYPTPASSRLSKADADADANTR